MTIQKKLVIIGNTYAKNYLLYTYDRGVFIPQILPDWTPSEIHVQWDEQVVELKIANPCFRPEYARLRPLAYQNSDVIVACFALDSPDSLDYIRDKFRMEAKLYCPEIPVVLVGIKSDLRDEVLRRRGNLVSVEDALMTAVKISAVDYFECSPKMKFNVEDVFARVAEVALFEQLMRKKKKKKQKKRFWFCCSKM